MNAVEMLGYAAVAVNIGVYLMRTMIPLRIFAVTTNCMFIGWAFLDDVYPTLLLNCILLPLNGYRLAEMLILVRRTRIAAVKHDFDMNFIRPFTRAQTVHTGEKLFAKGDAADAMYIIETGRFVLPESGIQLSPGAMVGELGLLAPGGVRTQSLVCEEAGSVLRLSYDQFKQLHFQNPKFGFYFLQLTTERLFENLATLEQTLTAHGIPNPLNANQAVTAN
jgi:CRP/FNR family transcriptional regulator, cyclic AMP receptor protein